MPITQFTVTYLPQMQIAVEGLLYQMRYELQARGIEVEMQTFDSQQELELFLLNGGNGPEKDYEDVE